MAKLLIVLGLAIAVVGLLLLVSPGAFRWMGRLPGDIRTDHVSFPIVTCIVISILLTVLLNLAARLFR
ncbi:MAG TPA: DUF2905 domain-containing protein [Myxococcales bacterium]